jgi:hypothetical protein
MRGSCGLLPQHGAEHFLHHGLGLNVCNDCGLRVRNGADPGTTTRASSRLLPRFAESEQFEAIAGLQNEVAHLIGGF